MTAILIGAGVLVFLCLCGASSGGWMQPFAGASSSHLFQVVDRKRSAPRETFASRGVLFYGCKSHSS